MNINVNNFNAKLIKQVKNNNDGEKMVSKFEESLNDSLQTKKSTSSTKSSSKMEVEERDLQINSENLEDDLEKLKGIMYLLNMVSMNNKSPNILTLDQNVFNIENNMNLMEGISSEANNSLLFKMSMNEGALEQILSKIGFDQTSIDSKNITISDVIDKISTNPNNFIDLLQDGFQNINASEEFKNIFGSGNLDKILNDEQLLNNVRNELATKLNQESRINKENFEVDDIEVSRDENLLNSSVKDIENFNSVSKIKNSASSNENDMMFNENDQNSSKETDILKEISGEGNLNRGIENYFADNLKVNNSSNIIYRTINAGDPVKFAKDFIENIEYMSKNNKTEMVVKLNPDQLGKMDIKYEFAKESVRLLIRVERLEALKLLDNTITDIKNMIKENHQVNLDNIHVDLQQFEFNSNSQNQRREDIPQAHDNKNNTIKIDDEEIIKEEKKDLRTGILV